VRKASLTIVEAIFWSKDNGEALFAVFEPFNKEKATVGNGSMVGFQTVDKRKVDDLYALALSLGAQEDGIPQLKSQNFYGGYLRDLDGNKLIIYTVIS
jgi:predicted lactoylglutathione lyase